uniref:RRM domain-containing protein n=1 Tax=Strigamia maritima TaxID=126957 RepID=T1J2Q4_STRMM
MKKKIAVRCGGWENLELYKMVTRTKKIFVGGLSAPTTLEDVKNYFEQFGHSVKEKYEKTSSIKLEELGHLMFATPVELGNLYLARMGRGVVKGFVGRRHFATYSSIAGRTLSFCKAEL